MNNDDRLLELAEKATPRPWKAYVTTFTQEVWHVERLARVVLSTDTEYIAASANCLPDLVRRIRAWRDAVDACRDRLLDPNVTIEVAAAEVCDALKVALETDDALAAQMRME